MCCLLVHSKRLFDGVVPAEVVCNARRVGAVAQLGERLVRNEEVSGSIPLSSTKTPSNKFRSSLRVSVNVDFIDAYRPRRANLIC